MNDAHTIQQRSWEPTNLPRPTHNLWQSLRLLAAWLILLGCTIIITSSAESFALAIKLPVNVLLGGTLVFAGIAQIIQTTVMSKWSGSHHLLYIGLLQLAFGIGLLFFPIRDLVTASNFLVGVLAGVGLIKLLLAARLYPGRAWERLAFNGNVSLIVAFFLLIFSIKATVWVLGLVLGFELLFSAAWLLSLYSASIKTGQKRMPKKSKNPFIDQQCENNVIYYNFRRD